MATSDIFTKKDLGVRSRYLVSGAGGILFTLPLGVLYDRETEEEIAFFNAKKIDCVLYCKTPNGHYFKVIYPGNYEEVDRKKIIRSNFFIKRGSFHRSVLLELEY